MKGSQKHFSFWTGIITGVLLVAVIFSGLTAAEGFERTIKIFQYPVTFYFDGKQANSDGSRAGYFNNGKQEVPLSFIYEGTTYVPIRFVSESLEKEVGWDGQTYSVWVGQKPQQLVQASTSTNKNTVANHTVYGVQPGDSTEQVIDILGLPQRKDASHTGVEWWIYKNDLSNYKQIGIQNGKVVSIYSNGGNWSYEGVTMGMTPSQIQQKWGAPQNPLQITNTVKINGNQFAEKVMYKKDGNIVILYLDIYNDKKVRAIRVSTQDLSRKTIPSGYSISYYDRSDIILPSLSAAELARAEKAYELQVWDITNVIRYKNGLPLLKYNQQVADIARSHSLDMYQNNFFNHTSPTTGSIGDRLKSSPLPASAFGENIAAGYLDAADAIEGWMNSKGHRDNILNDYSNEMGVGIILRENQTFKNFYTQNFYYNRN